MLSACGIRVPSCSFVVSSCRLPAQGWPGRRSSGTHTVMPNDPSAGPSSVTPNPPAPQIPDHELLRVIGEGSYGEVWLARNVMGSYRPGKEGYPRTVDTSRPFQRGIGRVPRLAP